jgi:hypothetical protein
VARVGKSSVMVYCVVVFGEGQRDDILSAEGWESAA